METLHILGTGNAMVTKCFNTCFAIADNDDYLLVDTGGGNGILKQLELSEIAIEHIPYIFISHCHIDHILGAIWLIRAYSAKATKDPNITKLIIYGHDEVIRIIETMMSMLLNKKQSASLKGKLTLVEVKHEQVIKAMGHTLTFFDLRSTKDKQFGCHFELKSGIRLMFLGDEPYREHAHDLAYEADYLLHEAFCLDAQKDQYEPYKKHHCTAKDAAINADTLKVKNLLIYHTEQDNLEKRKEMYTKEAKAYYNGTIYVPEDLEVINLV